MRSFFYKITHGDLSADGDKLCTDVIDLYENSSYINYSVSKSNYGIPGQEYTFVGTNKSDGTLLTKTDLESPTSLTTNTGVVNSSRYIDKSGRIDVIGFSMANNSSYSGNIYVHNSDISDTNEEWEEYGPLKVSAKDILIDAFQYVRFCFDPDPDEDFELLVEIRIDRPVMTPLYRSTREIVEKFPGWMDIRNLQPEDDGEPATPIGVGGQLISSISGESLDELVSELQYRDFQRFIQTVDLDQKAWTYTSTGIPDRPISVTGDGVELARVHDRQELLKQESTADAVLIDLEDNALYTVREYSELTIDGVVYEQSLHHEWNYIDELGALVDLERLLGEANDVYRARIMDVYANRGGVGLEQFKLALRRELSLWQYEDDTSFLDNVAATPSLLSNYVGATPSVLEMEDIERDRKFFNSSGMPKPEFEKLVDQLSNDYPTTWGKFKWGQALWDAGGEDAEGYGVIPFQYDVDISGEGSYQAGVGDAEDLFVYRPDTFTGPRSYNARLRLSGKERTYRDEYRPIELDVEVTEIADLEVYDHPENSVWFTVELETTGATPGTYVYSFELSGKNDADHDSPTPTSESWSSQVIFSDYDDTTSEEIEFKSRATDELYSTDGIVPTDDIETVTLVQGKWDGSTYTDVVGEYTYEAWFEHDDAEILSSDNASPMGAVSYGLDETEATPFLPMSRVIMASYEESTPTSTVDRGDTVTFTVLINDNSPYLSTASDTISLQEFLYNQHSTNRRVEVKATTKNPFDEEEATPQYGGITTDQDDNDYFYPLEDILITAFTGDDATPVAHATPATSWDEDGISYVQSDTSLIEFQSQNTSVSAEDGTTISYPIETETWTSFQVDQNNTFSGTVDENGPWRNGFPPSPGNTDFTAHTYDSLTRDDFGLAHSDDYVVDEIGVIVDNNRVVGWLDAIWVTPANKIDSATPIGQAIEESIEGATYVYEPFALRARIKPGPEPEWYPQVHSGYFYDDNGEEYYFFAEKAEETATPGQEYLELTEVARQGAPVIVHTDEATPQYLRQVLFFDESSTPISLSHYNTETISGTGTNELFLSYEDVYEVEVVGPDDETIKVGTDFYGREEIPSADVEIWGTASTAPDYSDKRFWKFDASSNHRVDISDRDELDATGAFEILVKASSDATPSTEMVLVSKKNSSTGASTGWTVSFDDAGDAHANIRSTTDNTTITLSQFNDGNTHLVGLSRDTSNRLSFILDEEKETEVISGSFANSNDMVFGASDSGAHYLTGRIYWVAYFNAPVPDGDRIELIEWDGKAANTPDSLLFNQNLVALFSANHPTTEDQWTNVPNIVVPRLQERVAGRIVLWERTSHDSEYEVTYRARNSFYVDYDVVNSEGNQVSRVYFDATPSTADYIVTYEASEFDPATPVDVALSPLHTTQSEGFVYISFNEYETASIRTHLSPSKILADGVDYMVISLTSLDENANPKPNQDFTLSTDFGTLSNTEVTTDADGFATVVLQSSDEFSSSEGTLTITGPVNTSLTFDIEEAQVPKPELHAAVSSHLVEADGDSETLIYGKIIDENFAGMSGITVNWKRGRTIYHLFTGTTEYEDEYDDAYGQAFDAGTVTTDGEGLFEIGPFTTQLTEDSGYWFVAIEAEVEYGDEATPDQTLIGDMVFWYEYPDVTKGVESSGGLPRAPMQLTEIDAELIPEYSDGIRHPYRYKDDIIGEPDSSVNIEWQPPEWFAISAYRQWIYGLSGNQTNKYA